MVGRKHDGRRGDAHGGRSWWETWRSPKQRGQRDLRDIEKDDLRQRVQDLQQGRSRWETWRSPKQRGQCDLRDIENDDLRQQVQDLQQRMARLEERHGKSNPMRSNVPERRSMDDPLFSNFCGGQPKSSSNFGGINKQSDFDYDSIFTSSDAAEPTKNSNNTILSMPVYDKFVCDTHIFYEFPGLMSNSPPPSLVNLRSFEYQKVEMEHNDHDHPNGVIILRVYIHCEGCGDEVFKCLRGYQGVEGVEIDAKNQKVIIKGEKADPIKLAQRLRKKTGKHVELIHPKLPKQDKEKEKMEEPPETIEVVLKINMHCDGCAKEVKCCIYDMEGVERVDVDVEKNVVRVKGNMDPHKLVEFIINRGGRSAEIVQPDLTNTEEEGVDCSCNCCASQQAVYAPQIFSDENPNACSVM